MEKEDYIKAGKIASETREYARGKDWVGTTVLEICEEIESMIQSKGAKCAFPVNTSINEIAAHYTAEPNDTIVIQESDVLKIDLGAQINGNIADTAVTVSGDAESKILIQTAEIALSNAMSMIKNGTKSSDVGKLIEKTIKDRGFKPIINLSGHSLDTYTIHAGKSVPNVWSLGSFSFSSDTAYACEPFVTAKKGFGLVRNTKIKNIFAIKSRKKTKDEEANKMLDFIWEKFNMLPFAQRWLNDWDVKESGKLLEFLTKKKMINAYPVLTESSGQKVAQAEHTFIPQEKDILITTK